MITLFARSSGRNENRLLAVAVLAGTLAGLLTGCSKPPESQPASRPRVAVSVLPQAYFVDRIADGRVEVEVMIPPGASPHTHEPAMQQMKAVTEADLYVKVGHPNFPFEKAWIDELIAENPSMTVVNGAEGVAWQEGDPHVWLAPSHVKTIATNLHRALVKLLPAAAGQLDSNLALFIADIAAVDRELRNTLADHQGRKFFVFHPAWGYFASEYGLVQVPIEAHSKEPSPAQLARLIEEAKQENAAVIFVQPQFSRQSAEVIAREVGAEVVPIDPLARDWLANLKRVAEAFGIAFAR
jgi:zinc transport system substrate-binding protein